MQIFHGDCREIMKVISPADLVLADPPYGETSLKWDKQVRGWMDSAEYVSSNLWCFGSLRMFMEIARVGEASRWSQAQELIWEKHNGSGFQADRFKRVHELIVQFYRGDWKSIYKQPVTTDDATARTIRRKKRPAHMGHIEAGAYESVDGGPRLMRSVIYARSCHGSAVHPTQKPVGIITPLLQYSVPAGGRIVECFMGSGSGLIAARQLGLTGVGIDIDERNCEIAAHRLQEPIQKELIHV